MKVMIFFMIGIIALFGISYHLLAVRQSFEERIEVFIDGIEENTTLVHKEKGNALIKDLEERKYWSGSYLLRGYLAKVEGDREAEQTYYKLAISHRNRYTSSRLILYTHKLLIESYIQDNQFILAENHIEEVFEKLTVKEYETCQEIVVQILNLMAKLPSGGQTAMSLLENILDEKLSHKGKLFYVEQAKDLCCKEGNYAKTIEYTVKKILIADYLGQDSESALGRIELGEILAKVGNTEEAIASLEEGFSIATKDIEHDASVKVKALLSLAKIYTQSEAYEKALGTMDKARQYKDNLSYEEQKEIELMTHLIHVTFYSQAKDFEKAHSHLVNAKSIISEIEPSIAKDMGAYLLIQAEVYNRKKGNNEGESYKNTLGKLDEINQTLHHLARNTKINYGEYSNYIIESVNNKMLLRKNRIVLQNGAICFALAILVSLIAIIRAKKWYKVSIIDELTGIYNRRYFNEYYKGILEKTTDFAIMLIDIDNFKKLNDTYGHQFGDKTLVKICKSIQNVLYNDYKLFRYGGEELITICHYRTTLEVHKMAEKIRKTIEEMTWEYDLCVTISVGVAFYPLSGQKVIEHADEKLYIAKRAGKNRVIIDTREDQ